MELIYSLIITTCQTEMDQILESIFLTASSLDLQFNGNKCSFLSLNKGEHAESIFYLGDQIIPQLASLDN